MHRFVLALLFTTAAFAGTPEQDAALREIEAFTAAQQRTDPLYLTVETELLGRMNGLIKNQPPAQWAPTIKRWYFSESERAHAAERNQIRAAEAAAIGKSTSTTASDRYIDRLEALEKDLHVGKLSPREHALHALEAARYTFPDDAHLIALREAKVPLATDYELGRLTRVQYDERWAQARARYQQAGAARERDIRDEMRAEQAGRAVQPSLGDRIRQQRGIRCASQSGPLGTTTTCQ